MVYGSDMSVTALLVVLGVVVAASPAPSAPSSPTATPAPAAPAPALVPTTRASSAPGAIDRAAVSSAVDPAAAADEPPPLPDDDELARLAAQDINVARAPLRRAARTASSATTRAVALRLLAAHDAGTATARICARSLRLDDDATVRRAAGECLGRLGGKLAGGHTPALVAALDDDAIDVVTMAGWALANVGDAAAVHPVAARAAHPDERVARMFRGYALRLQDRWGLAAPPSSSSGVSPPATEAGPTAAPPGVALTLAASGLDVALATGWLGLYGAMLGWFHGPLLFAAHGGPAGAEAGALAALGLSALGGAALSGYGFARADSLPLAHTVVQLGTFGTLAGYGAGQLVGFPPISGVAAANLAAVGSLAGMGLGMAFVEQNTPTMGALAAGIAASVGVGTAAATLVSSYGYPFDQQLGVMLVTGSVAGAATTTLLARADVGLFPVAGATLLGMAGGGVAAFGMAFVDGAVDVFAPQTEATGWVVLSAIAAGAALGGALGWAIPADLDPLRAGTLKLQPPTLALLPGWGVRPEPTAMAALSGVF
jgi:hypothetical protein